MDSNTLIAVGAGLFAFGFLFIIGAIFVMGFKALAKHFQGFGSYQTERNVLLREVAELREQVKSRSAIMKQAEA